MTPSRYSLITRLLQSHLLAFVLLVSALTLYWARQSDINLAYVAIALPSLVLLVVTLLERWIPFLTSWNKSHGDVTLDVVSAATMLGLIDPLLKSLAAVAVVCLVGLVETTRLYADTLGQASFAVQLLVVTLVVEFGRYWSHRLHHQSRFLWWSHAMHHSSRRLYAFNNLRIHPLNHSINFALGIFPMMMIGAPAEILLAYLIVTQPIVILQHANINTQNGVLNYLISTNELHRWHHSSDSEEANANYGNALIIWDLLFGTYRNEAERNTPAQIGLFEGSRRDYPENGSYFSQLLPITVRSCC